MYSHTVCLGDIMWWYLFWGHDLDILRKVNWVKVKKMYVYQNKAPHFVVNFLFLISLICNLL